MRESRPASSERQLLVLRLLADDKNLDEISALAGVPWDELSQDIDVLLKALDVQKPGQAVARGIARGIIGPLRSQLS